MRRGENSPNLFRKCCVEFAKLHLSEREDSRVIQSICFDKFNQPLYGNSEAVRQSLLHWKTLTYNFVLEDEVEHFVCTGQRINQRIQGYQGPSRKLLFGIYLFCYHSINFLPISVCHTVGGISQGW